MERLTLTYVGKDSWSRPVYEDCAGNIYKDVDARSHVKPEICTVCGGFDGEPDTPIKYIKKFENIEIEFVPNRITR